MKLTKATQEKWIPFPEKNPEPGSEPAEFLIRRVSPAEVKGLEHQFRGRVQKQKLVKGGREITIDKEKSMAFAIAYAKLAFKDTRKKAEFPAFNAEIAKQLGDELGATVEVGDSPVLDGRWNDALRDLLFNTEPGVMAWVIEQADEMAMEANEDEEGKE